MDAMKRRRYDDEFRASAVLMLEAAGYPDREGALSHVSKHLGVSRSTLRGWIDGTLNPPPADIRHKKGLDLVAAIQEELTAIFPAMRERREDATYRELTTAAGILIDKLQLLTGKPTWRGEIIDLLKSGAITPDDVEKELGNELARELFESVGANRV
jgi:transposase-like protein